MADFMAGLKKTLDQVQPNVSVTENGAIGYKTSGKKLVDLNFMLSSMRNMSEDEIWSRFLEAYNENPVLAVLWLFFARDAMQGCGERRTFRVIFERLAAENEQMALRLLKLIPEYGRWDDLVYLFDKCASVKVKNAIVSMIDSRLQADLTAAQDKDYKNLSLCAKWMPSLNTHSANTRRIAEELRSRLGVSPKHYRTWLSKIRKELDIVESRMSAGEWDEIDYESVPSKAAMVYRDAFRRHDESRYSDYLSNVKSGKAKIHSGVLYPYEIVHAYMDMDRIKGHVDETLEAQWKALPNTLNSDQSVLVVVDGSGSMCYRIGNTNVTCHDVARSLGIYFSEKLSGPYQDAFITFSASPELVRFNHNITLHSKLLLMERYDECLNTDIEATFDLILKTAVDNHLKQDELPANILIISDGEFDDMVGGNTWIDCCNMIHIPEPSVALFDEIRSRFEAAGYKMPRLIFWNVCSRTGTIPLTENEMGVALVSGFSQNIADMVMSGKLDPYETLCDRLLSDRYQPVLEEMKDK